MMPLLGGEGDDIMAGGKGDDFYVVDSIGDKISELAGQGFDSVNSFLANYTLGANLERLLVNGFSGTGNALDNHHRSQWACQQAERGCGQRLDLRKRWRRYDRWRDTGNDTLFGGAGADTHDRRRR